MNNKAVCHKAVCLLLSIVSQADSILWILPPRQASIQCFSCSFFLFVCFFRFLSTTHDEVDLSHKQPLGPKGLATAGSSHQRLDTTSGPFLLCLFRVYEEASGETSLPDPGVHSRQLNQHFPLRFSELHGATISSLKSHWLTQFAFRTGPSTRAVHYK